MSKHWLVAGRTLWFISGNMSKETTIDMVTVAREVLGLNPVDKEDLVDIRAIALPSGVT